MRIATVSAFVVFACILTSGCSKESVRGAAYESMRYKSNEVNALDPNYNPDAVPSYNEYRTQREQYLKEQEERKKRESR